RPRPRPRRPERGVVDFRQKRVVLFCRNSTGTPVNHSQNDVLRGTLDLLVLKTLMLAPMHGWGISQRIQQLSRGVLEVNQGSLYPALQRLEQKGWITSDWETTE